MNRYNNYNNRNHHDCHDKEHDEYECHDNDFDFGPNPVILNLNKIACMNKTYITSIWTGTYSQATVMCIPYCSSTKLHSNDKADHIITIVDGEAKVEMGKYENDLCYCKVVSAGCTIFAPAGTWHKITNVCHNKPLKLLTFYAPPEYPHGTIECEKPKCDC